MVPDWSQEKNLHIIALGTMRCILYLPKWRNLALKVGSGTKISLFFSKKQFLLISEMKISHVLPCSFFWAFNFCWFFIFIFPNDLSVAVAPLAPRDSAKDPRCCRKDVWRGEEKGCKEIWASCCQWERMEEGKGFPEARCLAEKQSEAHRDGRREGQGGWSRGGADRVVPGTTERARGWGGGQLEEGLLRTALTASASAPRRRSARRGRGCWPCPLMGKPSCGGRRSLGRSGACWGRRAGTDTFPEGLLGANGGVGLSQWSLRCFFFGGGVPQRNNNSWQVTGSWGASSAQTFFFHHVNVFLFLHWFVCVLFSEVYRWLLNRASCVFNFDTVMTEHKLNMKNKLAFYTSLLYILRESTDGDGPVWLPCLLQELRLIHTRCALQGILGCFLQPTNVLSNRAFPLPMGQEASFPKEDIC